MVGNTWGLSCLLVKVFCKSRGPRLASGILESLQGEEPNPPEHVEPRPRPGDGSELAAGTSEWTGRRALSPGRGRAISPVTPSAEPCSSAPGQLLLMFRSPLRLPDGNPRPPTSDHHCPPPRKKTLIAGRDGEGWGIGLVEDKGGGGGGALGLWSLKLTHCWGLFKKKDTKLEI